MTRFIVTLADGMGALFVTAADEADAAQKAIYYVADVCELRSLPFVVSVERVDDSGDD